METYLPEVITAINKCFETYGNDVSAETIAKALKPYIKSKRATKDISEYSVNKRMQLYYIEWYRYHYKRNEKFDVAEIMAISKLIKIIKTNISLLDNPQIYNDSEDPIMLYFKKILHEREYFPQFIKKDPLLTTIVKHFTKIIADVKINKPNGFIPTETNAFFNGNSNSKALAESRFNDAMQ